MPQECTTTDHTHPHGELIILWIDMYGLNSEIIDPTHEVLLFLKLVIINVGLETFIFLAKVSEIMQAD